LTSILETKNQINHSQFMRKINRTFHSKNK
jgi:hypothetical protein